MERRKDDVVRRLCRVVFVLSALSSVVNWQADATTTIVAARIGEQLQLNCSKPLFQASPTPPYPILNWQYVSQAGVSATTFGTIMKNPQVAQVNPPFKLVDPSALGPDYDIEFSLTENLSTSYTCEVSNITPVDDATVLEVVGLQNLQCQIYSGQQTEYAEGDEVQVECSVNYYQHFLSVKPNLVWSTDDGPVDGVNTTDDGNTKRTAIANITLQGADDGREFSCEVAFPTADAVNEFGDVCGQTFTVLHGVTDPSIDFDPQPDKENVVFINDVINCTCSGNPTPVYAWYDENDVKLGDSNQLTMTSDMAKQSQPITLICNVTNDVRGETYSASVSQTLTVLVDGSVGPVKAGTEAWVIVIAVVIPVVVIAAVIGGYFIYRYRRNNKSKTKKTTTTSNTNRPATTATAAAYTPVPTGGSSIVRPTPPPANTPYGGYNPARSTSPANPRPVSGHDSPAGHGALGVSGGVAMYTGSTHNLDTSYNSSAPNPASRPAYPYTPRNGGGGTAAAAPAVNMNPNPGARPGPVGPPPAGGVSVYPYQGPNRQPSVASMASSRSSAHSTLPPPQQSAFAAAPSYRSGHASLAGSEV